MLKIMTIVGTRPELIKMSRVIAEFDQHTQHVLVHTGQNFDDRLSGLFFRELEGDHAVGVLGTPLYEGRSLAVDTAFHGLGLPIYVVAPGMTHVGLSGLHRLMVAHDVGSAIKGPERGDVYFGTGDTALALAGVTKHPVTFFVLLPVVP